MITLQSRLFVDLDQPPKLLEVLQTALELEHATIPPYLLAAYSLKDSNSDISDLIIGVAKEEMLHMTLVCNLINALGGSPVLNASTFIPTYPGPLPGAVQDGLIVPLAPFSLKLLSDVFLSIEAPEKPHVFPVVHTFVENLQPAPETIGQFYRNIAGVIEAGGDALFADGAPQKQVVLRIDRDRSTAITNAATALQAIALIVDQGEGNDQSPLEGATGDPSHYYRFQEILKGRTLQTDATVPEGFSFSGAPIVFDVTGVYPVKPNLKVADIADHSPAKAVAQRFNKLYTQMLSNLHAGFNGQQAKLNAAINVMSNDIRNTALQLVQMEISPGAGVNVGPTFEYDPNP